MKNSVLTLIFAALTAAAVPAQATTYNVNLLGTVYQTQGATGQGVGSLVTGHFDLDSVSGNFLDFSIDSKSVAAGFQSSAVIVPAMTDAIYTAQISPVSTGGTSNNTFTLDLSSLTSWPATDTAFTLLTDTPQLTTNLDTVSKPLSAFPSTFRYYTANSDGTNVVALGGNLTSISVTATPEPATFALLGTSLFVLGVFARRLRRT